jgi:hypothetical protein
MLLLSQLLKIKCKPDEACQLLVGADHLLL